MDKSIHVLSRWRNFLRFSGCRDAQRAKESSSTYILIVELVHKPTSVAP